MKKIAYTKPEIEIQELEIESLMNDTSLPGGVVAPGGESGNTGGSGTDKPDKGDAKDFSTPSLWD